MASEKLPLSYKGHPLRRKDNLIYYGTMAEKYIIMLQVLATQKVNDLEVATKVSVQLQLTDPDLKSRDRVVKKSEKDNLYAAMDVAAVWLDRALSGKYAPLIPVQTILCKERMEEPHHAPVQSTDRQAGRLYPGGHRRDYPFLCSLCGHRCERLRPEYPGGGQCRG